MEFIQDYIMRMINQMIKVLLKLLFNIESSSCESIVLGETDLAEKYNTLIQMAKNGKINEAENQIYDNYSSMNKKELMMIILFYDYINNFDDEFLSRNNYNRGEIKEGLDSLLKASGMDLLLNDIFLE